MAGKTVVAGSTVSASQLKDFFRQVDDGSINGRIMQAILEHRDPWTPPTSFTVTSNGQSGEEWIARLEAAKYNLGDYGKQLLRHQKFVATDGLCYKLGVIRGDEFEDDDRTTQNIWAEGERRGWLKPSMEQACLLREFCSDEEIERMGLWALIAMHEPVSDSRGGPNVLGLFRYDGGRWLDACFGDPGRSWSRQDGFVFLVPQE